VTEVSTFGIKNVSWRADDQKPELQNDDVLQLQLSNATIDEEPDWNQDKDEDEISCVEPDETAEPDEEEISEQNKYKDEPSKTSITEDEIDEQKDSNDEPPKTLVTDKKQEVVIKERSLTPLPRRRHGDRNDRRDDCNDRHGDRNNRRDDRNDRRQEDKRERRSRSRKRYYPDIRESKKSRSRNHYYPDIRQTRKCSCPPKHDYQRRKRCSMST